MICASEFEEARAGLPLPAGFSLPVQEPASASLAAWQRVLIFLSIPRAFRKPEEGRQAAI